MHWLWLKYFNKTINMSKISESRDYTSASNLIPRHCNKGIPEECQDDVYSEVLQVVSEMVDSASKTLTEECLEGKFEVASERLHKQKSDNNKCPVSDSDIPVRRSNRIRRSVVRKDEFVTPRPNKKANNKNQKTSDTSNQKITVVESKNSPVNENNKILEISEKILLDNKNKCKTDTKFSKEEIIETGSKILPEKNSKYKSSKKSSKPDKVNKKVPQNSKQFNQNEKKKTRKRKNGSKITDLEDSGENISGIDGKVERKSDVCAQPESLALTCTKVLNSVPELEAKCENQTNCIKQSRDQIEEQGSDKSVDCCNIIKPVKVKSRWWRSSELEAVKNSETVNSDNLISIVKIEISEVKTADNTKGKEEMVPAEICVDNDTKVAPEMSEDPAPAKAEVTKDDCERPQYDHIEENIYRFNRKKCKSKKQVRRMVCDCTLTKEEQEYGVMGCKEECLNRLLMIECGSRCPIGEACSNKKFQKKQYVNAEIFKTEKKGWGLRTLDNISAGDFLMEFVGEILNHKEYRQRVKQYAKEKNVHCYFMALKTDEILDATSKGNLSRFINHSCNPNCETQKWTVNGELRVGVFAKRSMTVGEELTLDYKFQRYGREAQKCYCGADVCSGYIGGAKQISIDAYSGKSVTSRKRKGSEDKKRDAEDMILEEEIEKLNGNRGLRNREDTLKLARLMVRADDSATRHQLLDIILKTEEQACLRLFLDYHGLPLLWSWMTDVMEWDLKAKILQVLSLLPISNKTMLLDSKVLSIVEKWVTECTSPLDSKEEDLSQKSASVVCNEETNDSASKKLKITDFSDSETDSTSSHTVADASNEMATATTEPSSKASLAVDEVSPPEILKESACDGKDIPVEDPDSCYKLNIANLASGLLNNWKNLKEIFRIPRLEQQKRKEDEMEVDNNAKEKGKEENVPEETAKLGDQIQVVISGKNVFSEHLKAFDYEQGDMKLEDGGRRFSYPRAPPVLAKPRQINKPIRHHAYPKMVDKEIAKQKLKDDNSSCSPEILSPTISLGPHVVRPPLLPLPKFTEQPPITFPPRANMPPASMHQPMENAPPPVIFPPPMIYPQPQMPFMGSAGPLHPHNPAVMPPPSVTAQPPSLIQQTPPPVNTSIPPGQPIPISQPNVSAPPPAANSFMIPPNIPPPSVLPGPSQFIPNQPPPVQNFPPPNNMYSNPNQPPVYFIPPQTSLPPNNIPPTSFPENIPVQPPSTFSAQPAAPVIKEEPKPVKLPKNWRTATDSEGNVYYYHSITRQTQWDPPSEEDESDEEDSNTEESESSDTPTYDEPKLVSKHSRKKSKRRKPTKAAADTSMAPVRPEIAKKIKELFRTKMSTYIVHCLNSYRKPDCTVGRITSNEDFKYLARKLTHYTMTKELKQCKNVEDLDCNETVMHKAKDFIKKYMAKYGSQYSRKEKYSPAD